MRVNLSSLFNVREIIENWSILRPIVCHSNLPELGSYILKQQNDTWFEALYLGDLPVAGDQMARLLYNPKQQWNGAQIDEAIRHNFVKISPKWRIFAKSEHTARLTKYLLQFIHHKFVTVQAYLNASNHAANLALAYSPVSYSKKEFYSHWSFPWSTVPRD